MNIPQRKNELQFLQTFFGDFRILSNRVYEDIEIYGVETKDIFWQVIDDEINRVKNVIYKETLNMDTNFIVTYLSQYLTQLYNLLKKISREKEGYMRLREYRASQNKRKRKLSDKETGESHDYHYAWELGISEFAFQKFIQTLIDDYGYFFDSLKNESEVGLIINDFKKNIIAHEENKSFKKIKWTKSAQDFAIHFQPLILKKTLQLNNKSDVEPIVKLLYDFFEINSEKHEGNIELATLQKYFKDAKRDSP